MGSKYLGVGGRLERGTSRMWGSRERRRLEEGMAWEED